MRKLLLSCALMFSLTALVGCNKDDDDEPGSGSSNVSTGNVKIGNDSFTAKYAFVVYGSNFDSVIDEYIFADKDLLKYSEIADDIDDVDEEFSTVYFDYNNRFDNVEDMYIEYKYNGYKGTGFYVEFEDSDIDDYVNFSASKKSVEVSGRSIPMVRYNVRTGNESDCEVSLSLKANPIDVSDLADYEDDYYSNTRASVEVKEITDPKQISFLRSLRNKRNN